MRIVYRMRGLLGDATEEFIESLDSTTGTPSPHMILHVGLQPEQTCLRVWWPVLCITL